MKPRILTVALASALIAAATLHAQQRPAAPSAPGSKPAVKSSGNYAEDAKVVRDSQEHAIELAQALAEKAQDPKSAAAIEAAIKEMERAVALLEAAKDSPEKLGAALAAEQAAYASLLKLAAREFNVSRQKGQKSGQKSASQQSRQRQLDQLDLKMSENKYEQQRLAQEQKQAPEQREQLQVLNRLQELARRQQDLNERLKELQTALKEAKTEQEKEDIRRRLKRLQEEQQQMLADVDELRQRMEREENQARMQQERQQLEQTRQDVQRAAEAMERGNVQQALASGTRAQQELQQMRDEMRKRTSNQFAEEMRQMRMEARDLAQTQEEIGKALDPSTDNNRRKTLTEPTGKPDLVKQLGGQKQHLTNLVERAKELSERAEQAEPLLHKQLYDTVRKNASADASNIRGMTEELLQRGKMLRPVYDLLERNKNAEPGSGLDITAELLKNSFLPEARNLEERSRRSIDEFKKGVERAAESVLGEEAEALRMARMEIEALAEAVRRELAQGDPQSIEALTNRLAQAAGDAERDASKQDASGKQGQPGKQAGDPSAQQQQAQSGKQPGQKQGEGRQPGKPGEPSAQGEQSGKQGGQQQAGDQSQQGQKQGGQQPGQQQGEGNQAGKQGGQQQAGQPQPGSRDQAGGPQRGGASDRGGRGAYRNDVFNDFLNDTGAWRGGPIRGEDFVRWSDRLRDVEEMIELPDLRLDVTRIRDAARQLRQESRKEPEKPQWAEIRTRIVSPLAEVSKKLGDELAKRDSKEALVPIDRDPVPGKFGELVRRYYQELGKSQE
jgi:hypothetical protein